MNKMMCMECGAKEQYVIKEVTRKYEGDGYCFDLKVSVPFCEKCGAPITNEELEEEISQKANEKIRKMRGIISKEDILKILEQYNVSQKYLSKLLGWGEITLTRYISGGYTPNQSNSDRLKELSNPYVFQGLLNNWAERQEENAEEDTLLHKAQKSVDIVMENLENKSHGLFTVVNWFLSQTTEEDPITHLALQKILYFTQGWSDILIGRQMISDTCKAWAHGAVYQPIYNEFKGFKYMPLPRVHRSIDLSAQELELLTIIKEYYYDVYSAKTLEAICHKEEPYILARKDVQKGANSNESIPKKLIRNYYKKVAEKYAVSLSNPSGIRTYLNDLLY